MKLQLNTDFLNQNVLLAVLAAAQVKGEAIEVESVKETEVTLVAPEGPVTGVVAICQYLLKETPLVANCTYLEKSQEFADACRKLFVLSAGGLKDVAENSSDEIKAVYAEVNKYLDEIVAIMGDKPFFNGETLSLDDLLIVSAIYPSIAKKSVYPVPPSISKKFIGFMKYVKKV